MRSVLVYLRISVTRTPELETAYPALVINDCIVDEFIGAIDAKPSDVDNLRIKLKIASGDDYISNAQSNNSEAEKLQLRSLAKITFARNRPYWPTGFKLSTEVPVPEQNAPEGFIEPLLEGRSLNDFAELIAGEGILASIALGVEAKRRNDTFYNKAARKYNHKIFGSVAIACSGMAVAMNEVPASNEAGRLVIALAAFGSIAVAIFRGNNTLQKEVSLKDEFDMNSALLPHEDKIDYYKHNVVSIE